MPLIPQSCWSLICDFHVSSQWVSCELKFFTGLCSSNNDIMTKINLNVSETFRRLRLKCVLVVYSTPSISGFDRCFSCLWAVVTVCLSDVCSFSTNKHRKFPHQVAPTACLISATVSQHKSLWRKFSVFETFTKFKPLIWTGVLANKL